MKISKLSPGKYKFDYRLNNKRNKTIVNCNQKDALKLKKQLEYQIGAEKLGLTVLKKKNPPIKQLVAHFLEEKKKQNLRKATMDGYTYILSLIGYKLKTKLNQYKPETYNSYVKTLNVFYNWYIQGL